MFVVVEPRQVILTLGCDCGLEVRQTAGFKQAAFQRLALASSPQAADTRRLLLHLCDL